MPQLTWAFRVGCWYGCGSSNRSGKGNVRRSSQVRNRSSTQKDLRGKSEV